MEPIDSAINYLKDFPWFANLVMVMGTLRLVFKPLFAAIEKYIAESPSKTDDEKWEKIKNAKGMKTFFWLLDFFASVKIPQGNNPSKGVNKT